MADVIITANDSTTYTLNAGDDYLLVSGVTHYTSLNNSIVRIVDGVSDTKMIVNGDMVHLGIGNTILQSDDTQSNISISIGADGSISSDPIYRAIFLYASQSLVTNAGTITGGEAINLQGNDSAIHNSGSIFSNWTTTAVQIFAVNMGGLDAVFTNTGIVQADNGLKSNKTINFTNSGEFIASDTALNLTSSVNDIRYVTNTGTLSGGNLVLQGGQYSEFVVNHGLMSGDIDFYWGIDKLTNTGSFSGDILGSAGSKTIDNTGTMTGNIEITYATTTLTNAGTLVGYVSTFSYADNISNTGEITGSLNLSGGTDTLFNSGQIGGSVQFGINEDQMLNSGTVAGSVLLLGGNDTYTAAGDGVVLGGIEGGAGDDTITGGNLSDYIDGGDDNDRIYGRDGDDDLRAGTGADFVSGGMGDDQILGDDGADKMFGGDGDDTLNGGRDKDTIRGGDGNDEIKGGRLNDVLNGGAGADVFVYDVKQDSSTGASDVIQDFEVGIDVIDLSAVASGLTFVGTAAFSGTGNEVRYEIAGNGKTFIQVDTDANGSADMRIWLTDVGALSADEFVL